MQPIFYLSALLTFLCGMGLLGAILLTRTSRAASERMFELTSGTLVPREKRSLTQVFKDRAVEAAGWLREMTGMSFKAELQEQFVAAGIHGSAARDVYLAIRVVAPLLGLAAGSIPQSHRVFFMAVLAGAGYLGPDIVLRKIIKARRKRVRLSLPDAIDLLVICVEAGLGLDQAMLRVSQDLATSHHDLHVEFQIINREQRAGKQRIEAWQSMAARTALAEIDAFVNMLMQTERFGTPISRALSTLADGLRQKRRQRAEELAAKTTVKIMFPLVFFIFPTLFIVLIGPAVINMMHSFSSIAK